MPIAARYAVAVVATTVAVLVTIALPDLLAPMRLFFLWAAVLITAVVAGTGPGLFATALTLGCAAYFVFGPHGSLILSNPVDLVRLTLFALFAGGISVAVGMRRTLGERLLRSEQRYRTLVESTPIAQAVWTSTPEGKVQWAPEWPALTGDAESPFHPDDLARTTPRWRESLASGARYEDEVRVRVATGGYRWFTVEASPVRHDGRIVEWIGIISDVHDRKRAEENAAFINRASEMLTASLASEQTLRNLARLCVPALGDWCAIDLADGPEPSGVGPVRAEPIVAVLQSGRTQILDEAIIAPMIARGRALGALTVARGDSGQRYSEDDVPLIEDLARRAAMSLENARLYEAAEAANRAKDEFLATLSHELRTPLTAISGWAHMLELGISDPDTHRLAVQTIVSSARAQTELIDDLLDLSSVVAGTMHLEVAPVDLVAITLGVLEAAKPAADAKGVAVEGPAQVPVIVRGDERRLRQIGGIL